MSSTNTPTEKWKTIPGFPNYAISNRGRVARKRDGYLLTRNGRMVRVSHDGKERKRNVPAMMEELWGITGWE
jgi:hypothetical protein